MTLTIIQCSQVYNLLLGRWPPVPLVSILDLDSLFYQLEPSLDSDQTYFSMHSITQAFLHSVQDSLGSPGHDMFTSSLTRYIKLVRYLLSHIKISLDAELHHTVLHRGQGRYNSLSLLLLSLQFPPLLNCLIPLYASLGSVVIAYALQRRIIQIHNLTTLHILRSQISRREPCSQTHF